MWLVVGWVWQRVAVQDEVWQGFILIGIITFNNILKRIILNRIIQDKLFLNGYSDMNN